jgi:hypothetical protein
MGWSISDALATLLVAAILVPYLGLVAGGSMPLIHDTLAMAATAFIGWVAVFLLAGRYDATSRAGITELVLFAVSLTLGAAAVLAAETATVLGSALLAVFVAAIVVTWTMRLVHDPGLWRHGPLATQ